MRTATRPLLCAVLAVLAVSVSAQCPEVPEDCQFQYTNIRLESSTPTLSSLHGDYSPGNPGDVSGVVPPPPDMGCRAAFAMEAMREAVARP